MRVYGVDITIPDVLIVPVDNDGYLTSDFSIEYTIGGDDYNATSAYLFVYKDDILYDYLILETGTGKEVSLSRGTYFDMESQYKVQIIVNYGSSIEMKGDIVPIYFSSYFIEKVDPEFPDVKLNWDDYYPALGNKTIVVRGVNKDENGDPIPLTGKVRAEVVYPSSGMDLSSSVSVTPLEANFVDGRIGFTLSAPSIAPPINNDVKTGLDKIEIRFNVFDDEDNDIGHIDGKWNVKNNSNTNLKEVLDGKAVFAIDVDSNGAVKTGDNHKGQTTGNTPATQEFDYVLKMINHIVPILRTPVAETNQENTLSNYGYYGGWTENVMEALLTGGNNVNIGSDTSPKNVNLVENIKISHQLNESGSINTIRKLIKDYSGLTDVNTDKGKVIDQEILVGLDYSELHKHPVNDPDIGIYELYENDDWDEDGLSNYVEVENEINPLEENSEYTTSGTTKFSYPRGVHGDGRLINALRLPNSSKGYYHFQGGDDQNYDSYSMPLVLKKIEKIAKLWKNSHPDLAPLMEDVFITYPGPNQNGNVDKNDDDKNGIKDIAATSTKSEVRIGIGDVSTQNGGYWGHAGHQNGLGIDVRYVRKDNTEGPVWVSSADCNKILSQELVNLFKSEGAVKIFTVADLGIPQDPVGGVLRYDGGHVNHFHVSFENPNPPDGAITMAATVPQQEVGTGLWVSTITTTTPILDRYGYQLFDGFEVSVETDKGEIYVDGNAQGASSKVAIITVNSQEGHLAFQIKSPTSGDATVSVATPNTYNCGQATGSALIHFP